MSLIALKSSDFFLLESIEIFYFISKMSINIKREISSTFFCLSTTSQRIASNARRQDSCWMPLPIRRKNVIVAVKHSIHYQWLLPAATPPHFAIFRTHVNSFNAHSLRAFGINETRHSFGSFVVSLVLTLLFYCHILLNRKKTKFQNLLSTHL